MAGAVKLNHANEGIVFTVGSQRAEHGAHLDVVEGARTARPAKRRDDASNAVVFDQPGPGSYVAVYGPEASKRVDETVPGERGPPGEPSPRNLDHMQGIPYKDQLATNTETPPHV
jgi:hypothetical protein